MTESNFEQGNTLDKNELTSRRNFQRAELESFADLWDGGFFVADPAEKLAPFSMEWMIGVYHVIYLTCVRPWITKESRVLEIGCGRGAWTRLFLIADKIDCLDALTAEHNSFYSYVGEVDNLNYHQVKDFSMSMIADNSIDYVFSYDALCHVSFDGISEYARSLHRVMKSGGHAFLMVADYQKYNEYVNSYGGQSALLTLLPKRRFPIVRKFGIRLIRIYSEWDGRRHNLQLRNLNEDNIPRPGRWYHAGGAETSQVLRNIGFTVLDEDMGVDPRSPIIHFRR